MRRPKRSGDHSFSFARRSARVLSATICLVFSLAGPPSADGDDLFSWQEGPEGSAVLRVDPSRSGPAISRRLFGKFTEHLHRNIYHGMWAQVLRNPGFEDWNFFFSNDLEMRRARERDAGAGQAWPEGLAAHWLPEGAGEISYSLDRESVNSESSQHVVLGTLTSPAAGLRQERVHLPLHRESDYVVTAWLRSREIGAVTLRVRQDDRTIAGVRINGLSQDWRKYRVRMKINEGVDLGAELTLSLTSDRSGEFWVDQLLIFPGDSVHGFDRDVVEFCRAARLSLLRYPGGNFASGYHWKDGIGDVDHRPMRRNPAWNCPEYNHVGTDEFMAFCEAVGCEPMICVNAGDGTAGEAAQWVEYCNGPIETRFGALRAQHGHPRPYGVRYWEIGNELYGGWQVGHCSAEEYARRYALFLRAMREVDPTIRFIANGHDTAWHAPLLASNPELVRSFSLHPLIGGGIPRRADPVKAYRSLLAYPSWYEGFLRRAGEQMQRAGVEPRLAITELQIFTNKPELPTNGTLSEAVYMARYFHTAVRLGGLVEMITHSALVNHGGGLRKQRGVVYAQPSWWATHLYSTMEGTIPLAIAVQTPFYSSSERSMPTVERAPYVDALALTDRERSVLTLMIVNTHPDAAIEARIDVGNWPLPERVVGRRIGGASILARNDIEARNRVALDTVAFDPGEKGTLSHRLPPCSVTELVLRK